MFDFDYLTKVLNGPSYYELPERPVDSATGNSPEKITELCKQSLDAINATESPFKKCEQTNYGGCPFSLKAIEWKRKNNLTAGLNVAIIIFNLPGSDKLEYIIGNTSGGPWNKHSEIKLFSQLPRAVRVSNENIKYVFTERRPCRKGSNCHRKLKKMLHSNTGVIFSIPHSPTSHRQKMNETRFQKLQEVHGIRVADRKVRKALFT